VASNQIFPCAVEGSCEAKLLRRPAQRTWLHSGQVEERLTKIRQIFQRKLHRLEQVLQVNCPPYLARLYIDYVSRSSLWKTLSQLRKAELCSARKQKLYDCLPFRALGSRSLDDGPVNNRFATKARAVVTGKRELLSIDLPKYRLRPNHNLCVKSSTQASKSEAPPARRWDKINGRCWCTFDVSSNL
jgi:hypothetical protein